MNETIAAIATALSPSGLGIVRISGEEAVQIADRIFHKENGIKFDVICAPTKKILGLFGGKKAQVRASYEKEEKKKKNGGYYACPAFFY